MWYIVKWTSLNGHSYTRDFTCPDGLSLFLNTLIVNGFDFNVQTFKQEQA